MIQVRSKLPMEQLVRFCKYEVRLSAEDAVRYGLADEMADATTLKIAEMSSTSPKPPDPTG